jgi:hypothetical protein
MTTKDGFTITCSPEGHTVTVTESVKDGGQFATELSHAHDVLRYFRMTRQRQRVGCDGVDYDIQKRIGMVRVNKSGVGRRKFQFGIAAIKERHSHSQSEGVRP